MAPVEQGVAAASLRGLGAVLAMLAFVAWADVAGAAAGYTVAGRITYYASGLPVPGVTVRMRGAGVRTTVTDAAGGYRFVAVPAGSWTVEPEMSGALRGAVSVLDAVFVLQEVVHKRSFSALQVLACDTTGNGQSSVLDGVRILQLAVGKIPRLPVAQSCASDWAFAPRPGAAANQRLTEPALSIGACQGGTIAYAPLAADSLQQDFTALLFGDCTGNWDSGVPTPTRTDTPSGTPTPTPTATWTDTPAPTSTRTWTATSTATATPSPIPSWTPSPTPTATVTPTFPPTATPTCGSGFVWDMGAPVNLFTHISGNVWLAKTVWTGSGWGVFWLREEPGAPRTATLYYAHVAGGGQVDVAPVSVLDIAKIPFRGRYYLAAWHTDHYGLLIADRAILYYYDLAFDGILSGKKRVGPTLLISDIYDQESDGDLDTFPGGFLGVIEGSCGGHSCAFAFRLDAHGNRTGSVNNLVDGDFTHQFYPRSAYDGAGFAIVSVKDISISRGGVTSKYMQQDLSPTSGNKKVVTSKEYLWDEFPDVAWNGDHFAALWTENSARDHQQPWQIHFASFRRDKFVSTPIADRVLDVWGTKSGHRWTTQLHALGANWIAQYVRWQATGEALAVYEYVTSGAETLSSSVPFPVNDDALGSSLDPATGRAGIARSYAQNGVHAVTFQVLRAPVCGP